MVVRELVATLGLEFVDEGFEKAEHAFHELHHKLGAIGAVAAGAFASLAAFTYEVAEHAEKLHLMSEELGVSTDDLQELGFAARVSGVGFEEMSVSLRFLQKNLAAAHDGNKELAKVFEHLGGTVDPTTGRLRSAQDVLGALADRMKNIRDPAERVRLAVQLLGRSGAQMIPVLIKGREGLAHFAEIARKSGSVMSESFIEKSVEMNHHLAELHARINGTGLMIAEQFLPVLSGLVDGFLEWYSANQTVINQLAKWGAQLIASPFRLLGRVLEFVADKVRWLYEKLFEIDPKLGAAAVAATALGAAFLAPQLAIAAVGAAILIVIDDLEKFEEGGVSVTQTVIDKWQEMRKEIEDSRMIVGAEARWRQYGDTVKQVAGEVGSAVMNALGLGFLKRIPEDVDAAIKALDKLIQWIGEHKGELGKSAAPLFSGITGPLSNIVGGAKAIGSFISSGADTAEGKQILAENAAARAARASEPAQAGAREGSEVTHNSTQITQQPVTHNNSTQVTQQEGARSVTQVVHQTNHVVIHAGNADHEKVKEMFEEHTSEQYQHAHAALTNGVDIPVGGQ